VPAVHHELSTARLAVARIDRAALLTCSSPEASTD